MTKKNFAGIDVFRFVASLFVIAIHISPFSCIDADLDFLITYCIGRIAVPFFLMTTGYFVLTPYARSDFGKENALRRSITKNATLYLAATLLYLPISIYAGNLPDSFGGLLRDIFFDGTFYHLWYFPAAILGCIFVALLIKCSVLTVFACAIATYVIGLFGDSYYGLISEIPLLKSAYDALFQISSYTRNGIFFAPIFLLLGMLCAVPKFRPAPLIRNVGMAISLGLMLIEGFCTYNMDLQRHNSMYVFLVPTMYFFFQILLSIPGKAPLWMRETSMLIYILHPAIIVCLRGFAKAAKLTDILIENTLIQYVLVCAISCMTAYLIHILLERGKQFVHKRTRMDRA